MINVLISKAENEKISVYRFVETITNKGGTRRVAELIRENLTVSVQPSSSLNSVGGQQVVNSIAGKENKEVYIVYSPKLKLFARDLILRSDGLIYEVQHVENRGRGTILQHDKYYIVEYENQKVLKNE